MKFIGIAALCALGATGTTAAQSAAADQFADGLAEFRREAGIPSFSVIVIENGEIVSESYLGFSDDEGDVATGADTSYFVASVTKAIAGTTLFLADRAGEIDLDTPLADAEDWQGFCEWFPDSSIVFAGGDINGVTVPDFACAGQTLRNAVNMRVNGEPGTDFLYNPLVFARISRHLDEVHSRDFRSLVYDYALDPAEMRDTAAGWRDAPRGHVLSHLAPPMHRVDGRFVKQPLPDDDFRAAAGLYMTARDLARFDIALSDGTLMSDALREEMWTPPMNADGQPSDYVHGWFVQRWGDERLIYHTGWQPQSYSAIYLHMPERQLTLIALANSEGLWWGSRPDRAEIHNSPLVQRFFEAYGMTE
ncbi:serine hydrolase domain-containing protein [Hyphobacterium sp.]|uniref:serine hydrolase domain-containing protein n=1 Tax=Hyphobacterium sp. TaxID=2004662 RepID=UPI003BA9F49A